MKNSKINPKWKSYNDLNNEGGEGFNPHSKFISPNPTQPKKQPPLTNNQSGYCRDERGNTVARETLAKRLEKDIELIQRLTNDYAIKITQESINFAKKELGL